jgi:integrase
MKTSKRSQKKRAPKTAFTSIYGSVRVYTRRHINGCTLRDPNESGCSCPKWLYLKPVGGRAAQKAAGTPSFTEACGDAQRILKGFDPEIAAARVITQPVPGITVESCLEKYQSALSRRSLSDQYLRNCVVPFKRRRAAEYEKGRAKNLSLLDFLDRINLVAREPVTRMEQLTSNHLDEWAVGWKTNDLSSRLWRGVVTTFLKWARTHDHISRVPEFREKQKVKRGNRCGYFTDDQYEKLCQSLPFYRMKGHAMPENYAARLGAFMDAGRWGGMAVCDIVAFSPRVSLGANNVLTYRRRKSGQIATVLLDPAVAARLRSIPPEAGSDPDKPFRFPGTPEEGNGQLWRDRFKNLCDFAGITELETEIGVMREPHPHALRDSFAIDAITHGVRLENVAKMLGHANSQMTERAYLFWVKTREDHCIEDQRLALVRRAQVENQPAVASRGQVAATVQ